MIKGTWPENDIRRAFVAGAAWWEYYKTNCTMWQSDIKVVERQAEARYGSVADRLKREILGE